MSTERLQSSMDFEGAERSPIYRPLELYGYFLSVVVLALLGYAFHRLILIYRRRRCSRYLMTATRKALKHLPVRTLSPNDAEVNFGYDQCAICIELFKCSDVIRVLPCRHFYHKKCIDPWLREQRSCPLCKLDVMASCGLSLNKHCVSAASENDTVTFPSVSQQSRFRRIQRFFCGVLKPSDNANETEYYRYANRHSYESEIRRQFLFSRCLSQNEMFPSVMSNNLPTESMSAGVSSRRLVSGSFRNWFLRCFNYNSNSQENTNSVSQPAKSNNISLLFPNTAFNKRTMEVIWLPHDKLCQWHSSLLQTTAHSLDQHRPQHLNIRINSISTSTILPLLPRLSSHCLKWFKRTECLKNRSLSSKLGVVGSNDRWQYRFTPEITEKAPNRLLTENTQLLQSALVKTSGLSQSNSDHQSSNEAMDQTIVVHNSSDHHQTMTSSCASNYQSKCDTLCTDDTLSRTVQTHQQHRVPTLHPILLRDPVACESGNYNSTSSARSSSSSEPSLVVLPTPIAPSTSDINRVDVTTDSDTNQSAVPVSYYTTTYDYSNEFRSGTQQCLRSYGRNKTSSRCFRSSWFHPYTFCRKVDRQTPSNCCRKRQLNRIGGPWRSILMQKLSRKCQSKAATIENASKSTQSTVTKLQPIQTWDSPPPSYRQAMDPDNNSLDVSFCPTKEQSTSHNPLSPSDRQYFDHCPYCRADYSLVPCSTGVITGPSTASTAVVCRPGASYFKVPSQYNNRTHDVTFSDGRRTDRSYALCLPPPTVENDCRIHMVTESDHRGSQTLSDHNVSSGSTFGIRVTVEPPEVQYHRGPPPSASTSSFSSSEKKSDTDSPDLAHTDSMLSVNSGTVYYAALSDPDIG